MSIFTLVEFNLFKISFSTKTRTMMVGTEEIMLLTLILRRRCRKKDKLFVQHVQNLDFGCEIFLPEEISIVYFIGW